MHAQRTYSVVPRVPEALRALSTIAADLAWVNEYPVRALFRDVDSTLSELDGFDAIGILARVSQDRLAELANDPGFVARAEATLAALQAPTDRWFPTHHGDRGLGCVAYISAEYGIAASVPQYSGGLGVLAGDHLEAASSLGVPLVAVGLFYRHGDFRQQLDRASRQVEQFPRLVPAAMAMEPVDDLHIEVELGGANVRAAVWEAHLDGVPLYLLDTELDTNDAPDQLVTDRLYGGEAEQRIRQELLLGVGGLRVLRALGRVPQVFHLNEGHAGFLALELIRIAMRDEGLSYDEALEAVRPRLVFTTHTPVPAGIDRLSRELIERYLGWWCHDTGRSLDELMALGAESDDHSVFNLAAMSLRLAGWAGGVSQLHGDVSRHMFNFVWPQIVPDEVPITSVTNGVHAPTWVDPDLAGLFAQHVGPDWLAAGPDAWSALLHAEPSEVWAARNSARNRLVAFARRRLGTAIARRRGAAAAISWSDTALDPNALTIGFARRFATYKRATLLLHDIERFRRLVTDPQRPVQFVFAGKAHPADQPGKEFLRAVATLADDPELWTRVVFLEDYDIDAGRALTQGCYVWLNTPLRPMEACGTSGMKSVFNGGLNCSVLDGWWDEWFTPDRGWAIPSADWIDDPAARDLAEADWIFDLFERDIVPLFFDRDPDGIPQHWVRRVQASMAGLCPRVSAHRMVRDYVESAYLPAAERANALVADGHTRARGLSAACQRIAAHWSEVAVVAIESDEHNLTRGADLDVVVTARVGSLAVDDVSVQILHGPVDFAAEFTSVDPITLEHDGDLGDGVHRFRASVTGAWAGTYGYSVRIVPHHRDLVRVARPRARHVVVGP